MASFVQAENGVAGNQDFPEIFSGAGTRGDAGTAGSGASGGGASGGGGSYGGGNDSYADSGGGGGGAGGCPDAGGGTGGQQTYFPGGNAYNPHTTPTKSTNYMGQSSNLGRGGQGQTSSQTATNGYNGWFYIVRFQPATPFDMGNIDESVTRTIDCLGVTGTVDNTLDMGQIA